VHFGATAAFSDIPALIPVLTIDALLIGVGIGFKYNGNGLPDPKTGMPVPANKISFGTTLEVAYVVYEKGPFCLFPLVSWFTTIAPGPPVSLNVVSPGLGFAATPWNAPLLLLAAWQGRVTLTKGQSPTFDAFTPALAVGYIFK
jgi:hypothetical protein